MTELHVKVVAVSEGRVQGVGYREFTRRAAELHGVGGWTRNRPDGRVESCLIGPEADVERVLEAMRRGPDFAAVTAVRVVSREETPDSAGRFEVRR